MENTKFRFGESGCIICDPCYVINDDDYDKIWDDKYNFADGIIDDMMMVRSTGIGDGLFEASVGPEDIFYLPVDSGSIAIVNRDSESYDAINGSRIALHEQGIIFEGSGCGEITRVNHEYMLVCLEFDDGRKKKFKIDLVNDCFEGVNGMIVKRLSSIMEYSNAQAIAYSIYDDIVEDVKETADKDNWTSEDVDIAIVRVLKKRLQIEE